MKIIGEIFILFFAALQLQANVDDIYLVIYTSTDGKTGHVGIAVDNYKIYVSDEEFDEKIVSVYDTVKNHTLTYFDLWGPPEISVLEHNKNLKPRYFKLPLSSAEKKLSPQYFLTKGLPHAYDTPCDALLKIETTADQDYRLIEIAEQLMSEKKIFHTREYNCTDYIVLCLERLFEVELNTKEFIPFSWSSTPNKFYKEIVLKFPVEKLKDPGELVDGSFFLERIIKSL